MEQIKYELVGDAMAGETRTTFTCVKISKMKKKISEMLKTHTGKPDDLEKAKHQRQALDMVTEYLMNPCADWHSDPMVKAATRHVLETGSIDSAAAELKLGRMTVYRIIRRSNAYLLHKIGVTTLDKIEASATSQAMLEFSDASGVDIFGLTCLSARRLVALEVSKLNNDMKNISREIDIRACEKELRWLRSVNLTIMRNKLAEVDILKIRRLMHVLKSDDPKDEDVRIIVQRYLTSREDTTFETLDKLNDVSLYL